MNEFVTLKNGLKMPRLGIGMWDIGENPARRREEIAAVRAGIAAGMTLIDTAEMYGSGRSEQLVGEAIADLDREGLFLVSKVLPSNAGRSRIRRALEGSLSRMGTDHLDLYLYHWIGPTPLAEIVASMEDFVREGLIRAWGVSNFDTGDMAELMEECGGSGCVVNQVLYHLGSRGIEYDLLPWMAERSVFPMAYCPLAQGGGLRRGIMEQPAVQEVAARHQLTPAQVLLAFVLHNPRMIAIPRSSSVAHTLENAAVAGIRLDAEDLRILNRAFPAPRRKLPLDMC